MNPWESDPIVSSSAAPAGGASPWEHDPVVGAGTSAAPAKMTAEQFLNTKHEPGVMSPEERQQANLQMQHPIAQAQPPQMGAIRNAATAAFHTVADPLGNIGVRAAGAIGLITPEQKQQAIQNPLFNPEEGRTSATVGSALGNVAELGLGPVVAPITFGLQAGEQARERQEQRMANGEQISPVRQALDVAGQAALAYGFGKLAPGQKISQALLSKLPANIAARLVGAGLVGAGENAVQQVGQNVIAKKVGGEQDRSATEGVGEAAVTGGVFGAVGQGVHEAPGMLARMRAKGKANAVETQNQPAPISPEAGVHPPIEEPNQTMGQRREEQAPSRAAGNLGSPEDRPGNPETPVVAPTSQGEQALNKAWMQNLDRDIAAGQYEEKPTLGEQRVYDAMDKRMTEGEKPAEESSPMRIQPDRRIPHTEESILVRNQEVEAMKAANDPAADHAAAELQTHLDEYGQQHGEDAMENLIEKMQAKPTENQRRMGAPRKGAMAIPTKEEVTGPGSIFHEEVKPRIEKLSDAAKWTFGKLKDTFPMETGAGSKQTAQVFREEFNKANNNQLAVQDKFEEARRGFDKMAPDEQLQFQRDVRNNQPQRNPELQKIADEMYKDANEGRQKLVGLGNEAAKAWDDHHFSMLWKKDTDAAAALSTKINRPGKIEGQASFLKKRTLADFDEGLAKGLVPKYDNPVEMFLATRAERSKFIAGFQGMDRLVKSGSIHRIDPKNIPAGWGETPNGTKSILNTLIPGEGVPVAPDEVNRILKNIVTPSAIGNNPVYRMLQDANNTLTQSMLSLSGFHIRKVTQELVNLQAARALDLVGTGQTGEARKAMNPLGLLASPFKAINNGADIQKMMLGTKMAQTPEQQRVVDTMKTTFAAKADPAYETQFRRKLQKAIDQGGVQGLVRAGAYSPLAANEKIMQDGVFGYVQHAKLHLGSEMIGDYLRKNPNASPTELNKEAAKVSDHLDNVLGLMNRDNLFWNRTARDLATLSTLSVGWNYGSGRALAGGLVDLGKGLGGLAKGKSMAGVDTKRISYLATTAAMTALSGAVITYLATGKPPQRLRDYIFPPNGAKDREGHDIRINTGFYTTDYYDFMHDPINTLKAKGSPLLHAASDIATNKDFKGGQIKDTDDPWYKQAGEISKYLIKSGMPLSIAQYQQLKDEGVQHAGTNVAGLLGFKTAPKALSESDAEIKAHELLQKRSSAAGKTPAEQAKGSSMRQMENELRDKNPQAMNHLQQMIKDQKLSPKDVPTIQKRAKEPTGLKGLLGNSEFRPDDLMKIWDKMTPDERRDNQWSLRARIGRSTMLPADKQAAFNKIAEGVKK